MAVEGITIIVILYLIANSFSQYVFTKTCPLLKYIKLNIIYLSQNTGNMTPNSLDS